jgi:(1->4)-alpha-D-glucan 1-alpha-D-glucosylmutase
MLREYLGHFGVEAFSDGGRAWPRPESYDASLNIMGYTVEGFADTGSSKLGLSDLLRHLPVLVVKASYDGGLS